MTIIRVVDFETTGREDGAEVCEVGIQDTGSIRASFHILHIA